MAAPPEDRPQVDARFLDQQEDATDDDEEGHRASEAEGQGVGAVAPGIGAPLCSHHQQPHETADAEPHEGQ